MHSATVKEATKKHPNHRDAEVHPFQQARDDLDTAMHNAGQHVREFMENAGENIVSAKDSVVDVTENVAKKIKKDPIPASVIALGVGALLGGIFFRRK